MKYRGGVIAQFFGGYLAPVGRFDALGEGVSYQRHSAELDTSIPSASSFCSFLRVVQLAIDLRRRHTMCPASLMQVSS